MPAGAKDEWLCIDVPRGLRTGLDKLMPVRRKERPRRHGETPDGQIDGATSREATAAVAGGGTVASVEDDKLREARLPALRCACRSYGGALLQSVHVRWQSLQLLCLYKHHASISGSPKDVLLSPRPYKCRVQLSLFWLASTLLRLFVSLERRLCKF